MKRMKMPNRVDNGWFGGKCNASAMPNILKTQSASGIAINKAPLISIERIQALDTVGAIKEKRNIMMINIYKIVTVVSVSMPIVANKIGKYAIAETISKRPAGISFAKKFFIMLACITWGRTFWNTLGLR